MHVTAAPSSFAVQIQATESGTPPITWDEYTVLWNSSGDTWDSLAGDKINTTIRAHAKPNLIHARVWPS